MLVHSAGAGCRLAELVVDRALIAIAAISPAAADAAGEGWNAVETASQPNDDALWPSRHGCATNRRCNERHSRGYGLGRARMIALVLTCRRRGCDLGPCALPLCCAVLGVISAAQPVMLTPKPVVMNPETAPQAPPAAQPEALKIADLREPGSCGRECDCARGRFRRQGRRPRGRIRGAARHDRGVALGYLESLLVERLGAQHGGAVETGITASRQPVGLERPHRPKFDSLGTELRRGGPEDSSWTNFRREMGDLVEIHSATRPASNPEAAYTRGEQRLEAGNATRRSPETMRLPGASRAGGAGSARPGDISRSIAHSTKWDNPPRCCLRRPPG